MQWKLSYISDYLKNDRTRLGEASQSYTNEVKLDEPRKEILQQLSKQQLAVIDKLPQFHDSPADQFHKFNNLVEQWKPQSQIWPFVYNMKMLSFVNGLSSLYITHYFRRSFKLADGRTALLSVYVPALALPLFFGSVLHHVLISKPITIGKETCSVCQCLNAGFIQTATSTLYPMILSSITSVYFANYFNTYPVPDNIADKTSRNYLYNILLKAFRRNKIGFSLTAMANFLFGYYLTNREQETMQFMYISLLQDEYEKSNAVQQKQIA